MTRGHRDARRRRGRIFPALVDDVLSEVTEFLVVDVRLGARPRRRILGDGSDDAVAVVKGHLDHLQLARGGGARPHDVARGADRERAVFREDAGLRVDADVFKYPLEGPVGAVSGVVRPHHGPEVDTRVLARVGGRRQPILILQLAPFALVHAWIVGVAIRRLCVVPALVMEQAVILDGGFRRHVERECRL